jgi:hypothetical protein
MQGISSFILSDIINNKKAGVYMLYKTLLFTLTIIVLLCVPAIGCARLSSDTGNLHVLVFSEDIGPLAGAKVISNTQPEGQMKVTGGTQSDGTVNYNNIKAGEYEFYVSRFDYEQKEFVVTVVAGQTTNVTITLVRTSTLSPSAF